MNAAKVTLKGQVTIPKAVRAALGIQEGDSVIFSVEGDHALVKPFKKKSLLDFYGLLPKTRDFPGLETVRKEVRDKIARKLTRQGGK
jgi:AbrB family looped-hinge helix DNA binding protein